MEVCNETLLILASKQRSSRGLPTDFFLSLQGSFLSLFRLRLKRVGWLELTVINACISASGSSSFCVCVCVYVCMCVRVSTSSVCACAYECFPSHCFPESHSLSSRSNKSQEISTQYRRRCWQALLNARADGSARFCVTTHTHM